MLLQTSSCNSSKPLCPYAYPNRLKYDLSRRVCIPVYSRALPPMAYHVCHNLPLTMYGWPSAYCVRRDTRYTLLRPSDSERQSHEHQLQLCCTITATPPQQASPTPSLPMSSPPNSPTQPPHTRTHCLHISSQLEKRRLAVQINQSSAML